MGIKLYIGLMVVNEELTACGCGVNGRMLEKMKN
jgi:hypothetical protein